MKTPYTNIVPNSTTTNAETISPGGIARRHFVKGLGIAGASLLAGGTWLSETTTAEAKHGPLNDGDVAILRFLAAAEIIETDLWQQYNEMANGNKPWADALSVLDGDMVQYVNDNTDDEVTHADFLNAFLVAHGARPVNFDAFRTLPSSQATGAAQTGRLTNLSSLTVDTSWYTRYRGTGNPDLGDSFPQAIEIVNRPAIPMQDGSSPTQIQAIANVAAFHFCTVEQGGASLYANLAESASSSRVLRVIISLGGVEINHFAIWHDKAGNAPQLDTGDGLVFPDLNADPATQTNLIMPEPCKFISASLPRCSVIRPSSKQQAGAIAFTKALTDMGLFIGQSPAFFEKMQDMSNKADAALRIG